MQYGGTFDCLHKGHKEFLKKANEYGKLFIIVIPSKIKFENSGYPPIKDEYQRKQEIINYIKNNKNITVENIVIDNYENGLKSLLIAKPDKLCLGFDQNNIYNSLIIQFLEKNNIHVDLIKLPENGNGIHSKHLRQKYL